MFEEFEIEKVTAYKLGCNVYSDRDEAIHARLEQYLARRTISSNIVNDIGSESLTSWLIENKDLIEEFYETMCILEVEL
jgi:hypothetical protein